MSPNNNYFKKTLFHKFQFLLALTKAIIFITSQAHLLLHIHFSLQVFFSRQRIKNKKRGAFL